MTLLLTHIPDTLVFTKNSDYIRMIAFVVHHSTCYHIFWPCQYANMEGSANKIFQWPSTKRATPRLIHVKGDQKLVFLGSLAIWGFPKMEVLPRSSILDWDVPWNKLIINHPFFQHFWIPAFYRKPPYETHSPKKSSVGEGQETRSDDQKHHKDSWGVFLALPRWIQSKEGTIECVYIYIYYVQTLAHGFNKKNCMIYMYIYIYPAKIVMNYFSIFCMLIYIYIRIII